MSRNTQIERPAVTNRLGPRIKIQRAKKRIYELDAEIKGFLKRNPYPILLGDRPTR